MKRLVQRKTNYIIRPRGSDNEQKNITLDDSHITACDAEFKELERLAKQMTLEEKRQVMAGGDEYFDENLAKFKQRAIIF